MFNMRRNRKTFVLVLVVLMLTALVFPGNVLAAKGGKGGGNTTPLPTINYVALGDSIATGTVTYWSNITPYVTYFHQYLQSYYLNKATVKLQNLAQDGDRTNELLTKLSNPDSVEAAAVKTADIITISIGGNNLMQAAEIPGFTNIDWTLADQGVVEFNAQWGEIFRLLNFYKKQDAKIIVTTVYNPYNMIPPRGYQSDLGLHDQTDIRINQMNQTIVNNTTLGYKVADTFTAFDAYSESTMGKITYFYPSLWSYLLRNPHPNSTGQNIITELHKNAFGQF